MTSKYDSFQGFRGCNDLGGWLGDPILYYPIPSIATYRQRDRWWATVTVPWGRYRVSAHTKRGLTRKLCRLVVSLRTDERLRNPPANPLIAPQDATRADVALDSETIEE